MFDEKDAFFVRRTKPAMAMGNYDSLVIAAFKRMKLEVSSLRTLVIYGEDFGGWYPSKE